MDPFTALAITIGINLLAILLNRRNVEQGKIDSVDVDTASYGTAIPLIYGTQYVTAQTVWILNNQLIEKKKKKKILFGLAGSITTYTYFATFMQVLCEGLAYPGRIWMSDKQVGDLRGPTATGYDFFGAFNGLTLPSGITLQSFLSQPLGISGLNAGQKKFIYFAGSETQFPVQELINIVGPENSFAMRNTAGWYFEELPLADHGNAIPTIKAEVTSAPVQKLVRTVVLPPGASAASVSPSFDSQGLLWMRGSGPGGVGNWVYIIDPLANLILHAGPIDERFFAALTTGNNVPLIGINDAENGYNLGWIATAIPTGLASYAWPQGTSLLHPAFGTAAVPTVGNFVVWNLQSIEDKGIVFNDQNDKVTVLSLPDPQTPSLSQPFLGFIGVSAASYFPGTLAAPKAIVANTTGRILMAWTVDNGGLEDYWTIISWQGVVIKAPVLDSTTGAWGAYVAITGYFLLGSPGHPIQVIDEDGNLVTTWTHFTLNGLLNQHAAFANISQRQPATAWFINTAGDFIEVNILTGRIVRTELASTWDGIVSPIDRGPVPNPLNNLLAFSGGGTIKLFFFDQPMPAQVTASSITNDLVARSPLGAGAIDTIDATDIIRGLKVDTGTALAVIEDLRLIFDYDFFDRGDKYVLRKRTTTSVATVSVDDLGAGDEEPQFPLFKVEIDPETDSPWKVEVQFADATFDYENNVAYASIAKEHQNTFSTATVSTALTLTPTEAKLIAARILSSSYRDRPKYQFSIPAHKFRHITPGDPITVPIKNDNVTLKVQRIEGALALRITATPLEDDAFVISQAGTSRLGSPPILATSFVPSFPVLIDANAVDSNRSTAVQALDQAVMAAMPSFNFLAWSGADLYLSTDNSTTFQPVGSVATARLGRSLYALGDVPNPNLIDRANTITVDTLVTGLASATLEEICADPLLNMVWLKSGNDWEIIRFMTVATDSLGYIILSDLIRGDRGTEHLTGGHANGDSIIFYDSTHADVVYTADDTYRNLVLEGAATSSGASVTSVLFTGQITYETRGLRPYSPAYLTAVNNAGDIDISAIRRDKLYLADDLDGGDLTMSESVEAYKTYIVDHLGLEGTAGAILRTISHSTPNHTYTAAQYAADFSSPPATFTIRMVQLETRDDGLVRDGVPEEIVHTGP